VQSGTLVAVTNPFLYLILDYGDITLFFKVIVAASYNGALLFVVKFIYLYSLAVNFDV